MTNGGQNSGPSNKLKVFGAVASSLALILTGTLTFGTEVMKYLNSSSDEISADTASKKIEAAGEETTEETTQPSPSPAPAPAPAPAPTPAPAPKAAPPSPQAASPPPQQASLRSLIPNQVGNYALQKVEPHYNPLGAKEALRAMYQTSDGKQVLYNLRSYPSADAAEQAKRALTAQIQGNGFSIADTFASRKQGNQVGNGLVMKSSASSEKFNEIAIWTDNSILATIEAPQGGYGPSFYRTLGYT